MMKKKYIPPEICSEDLTIEVVKAGDCGGCRDEGDYDSIGPFLGCTCYEGQTSS